MDQIDKDAKLRTEFIEDTLAQLSRELGRDLTEEFWDYADNIVWESYQMKGFYTAYAQTEPNPTFSIDFSRTSFQQYVSIVREHDPKIQALLVTGGLAAAVFVISEGASNSDSAVSQAIRDWGDSIVDVKYCKSAGCNNYGHYCRECGRCSSHCECFYSYVCEKCGKYRRDCYCD